MRYLLQDLGTGKVVDGDYDDMLDNSEMGVVITPGGKRPSQLGPGESTAMIYSVKDKIHKLSVTRVKGIEPALPPKKRLGGSRKEFTPSKYQVAVFRECARGKDGPNIVVEAYAGCISGDAMIGCNRAGKGFSMRLADVVTRFNGGLAGSRTWRPDIPTYVRAPSSDGTVRLSRLHAATKSGIRHVLTVKIGDHTLQATPDHLFMTPDGWVRLDSLATGSVVLVEASSLGPGQGRTPKRNYLKRHVPCHPAAVNSGNGLRCVPTHRLNVEAAMNKMDLEAFVWRLQHSSDQLRFLEDGMVVHHVDSNHWNNGLDNLQAVTEEEHRRVHSDENTLHIQNHLL